MTIGKKVKSVTKITQQKTKVYDIEVADAHHYILGDGTVSHNSYVPTKKMGGGCLIGGTKIQTPEGLAEVQNIKVDDYVTTLCGDKRVTETFSFNDKKVFEISFDDGSKIKCSGDHKFLVDGKWKSVYVLLNVVKNTNTLNIEVADMKGDLNVYEQQIYKNLHLSYRKIKVA
jgi:intein/homing endonuclease